MTITLRVPSLLSARPRVRGGGAWRILAVVLIAALLGVNGWLWHRANQNRARERARDAGMAAAQQAVPKVLSYGYTSLDADLAAAKAETTGPFKSDFSTLVNNVVAPAAKSKRVTTKAVVRGAAVVQSSLRHVEVLVFVTQTTTSGTGAAPLITGSRVDVTMTKVGASWLVSALNPV